MMELEKKLGVAIDGALTQSIGEIEGTKYTLAEAIRAYFATQWKRLSEQKPEEHGQYLVYFKWGFGSGEEEQVAIDLWTGADRFAMEGIWNITHWMPLPPLPKFGGDERDDC